MGVRVGAQLGKNSAKLSPEAFAFISGMARAKGFNATARALGVTLPTLDRALGPGMTPPVRDRLELRVRELLRPPAAGELVCTRRECECSGSADECACIPDRPTNDRMCRTCRGPLRAPAD